MLGPLDPVNTACNRQGVAGALDAAFGGGGGRALLRAEGVQRRRAQALTPWIPTPTPLPASLGFDCASLLSISQACKTSAGAGGGGACAAFPVGSVSLCINLLGAVTGGARASWLFSAIAALRAAAGSGASTTVLFGPVFTVTGFALGLPATAFSGGINATSIAAASLPSRLRLVPGAGPPPPATPTPLPVLYYAIPLAVIGAVLVAAACTSKARGRKAARVEVEKGEEGVAHAGTGAVGASPAARSSPRGSPLRVAEEEALWASIKSAEAAAAAAELAAKEVAAADAAAAAAASSAEEDARLRSIHEGDTVSSFVSTADGGGGGEVPQNSPSPPPPAAPLALLSSPSPARRGRALLAPTPQVSQVAQMQALRSARRAMPPMGRLGVGRQQQQQSVFADAAAAELLDGGPLSPVKEGGLQKGTHEMLSRALALPGAAGVQWGGGGGASSSEEDEIEGGRGGRKAPPVGLAAAGSAALRVGGGVMARPRPRPAGLSPVFGAAAGGRKVAAAQTGAKGLGAGRHRSPV